MTSMDEIDTILATGAVAILSGLVGALVPAVAKLLGDWRARVAARRETIADLAGELLDVCERYRASSKDLTFDEQILLPFYGSGYAKRSAWQRARDDVRAQMRSLQVRIGARDRKLGASANTLVGAAIDSNGDCAKSREGFTAAMAE